MPYRQTPLVTDEYYHIYNRGVAYLPTFKFKKDYGEKLEQIKHLALEK